MSTFNPRLFSSWKLWLGLVLFGVLALLIARHFVVETRGAETKEELIAKTISAIRQEDTTQIANLTPRSYIVGQSELNDIVANAGGSQLEKVQVTSVPSESAQLEIIKLSGAFTQHGNLSEFATLLYVQQINHRWYLLVGRDKSGLPPDAPSTSID